MYKTDKRCPVCNNKLECKHFGRHGYVCVCNSCAYKVFLAPVKFDNTQAMFQFMMDKHKLTYRQGYVDIICRDSMQGFYADIEKNIFNSQNSYI